MRRIARLFVCNAVVLTALLYGPIVKAQVNDYDELFDVVKPVIVLSSLVRFETNTADLQLELNKKPNTEIIMHGLRLSNACGNVFFELNYLNERKIEYPAMNFAVERDQFELSHNLDVPPGQYRLHVYRSVPEACDVALAVAEKSTKAPEAQSSREEYEQDRIAVENLRDRLTTGLILRGKGQLVDLEAIEIHDLRHRMDRDLRSMSRYSRPRPKSEPYIQALEELCDKANANFRPAQTSGLDPDSLSPWRTDARGSTRSALLQLMMIGIARAYTARTGEATGYESTYGFLVPTPAISAVCKLNAVPFDELVNALQGPLTPRYHVYMRLPKQQQEDRSKVNGGYLSKLRLDLAATAAEVLGVAPDQLLMRWDRGNCSGHFFLAPGWESDMGGGCLASATTIVRIPRRVSAKSGSGTSRSLGVLNSEVVSRAIRRLAGVSARVEELLNIGPTMRLRASGFRGAVVPGGRDWEMLYVTVVQSASGNATDVTLVTEGLLASGLGSRVPPPGSFRRSMDLEAAAALQEFTGRLATALLRTP